MDLFVFIRAFLLVTMAAFTIGEEWRGGVRGAGGGKKNTARGLERRGEVLAASVASSWGAGQLLWLGSSSSSFYSEDGPMKQPRERKKTWACVSDAGCQRGQEAWLEGKSSSPGWSRIFVPGARQGGLIQSAFHTLSLFSLYFILWQARESPL